MSKRRDAEDIKRKKAVKERFRKLVRGVVLNSAWLSDQGEQKITLNVSKNIAMLVRTKRKIGMLTLAEKSLIRTHHYVRSVEDRKKLCLLIAGMTCFSKIPPKMRARLVPVIKFLVLNPGRVIMKEGHFPMTVYFILTGEVEMRKTVIDRKTNKPIQITEVIFGPGDSIGEVEMLEDCLRMNTYVAITQVELLVVFDYDYHNTLGPYMAKQWSEKKKAIRSLDYFRFLTPDQMISACKFAVLQQFEPLETIYYEDKGSLSYVHFVVSGECVILQCLNMRVTKKKGKKTFELVDAEEEQAQMFQSKSLSSASIDMKQKSKSEFDIAALVADDDDDVDNDKFMQKRTVQKLDLRTIEIQCGLRKPTTINEDAIKKAVVKRLSSVRHPYGAEDMIDFMSEESVHTEEDIQEEIEAEESTTKPKRLTDTPVGKEQSMVAFKEESVDRGVSEASSSKSASTLDSYERTIPTTHAKVRSIEPVVVETESHFIDVGSLCFGGIFGLGETSVNRVIMARTTVQCLMLPRFWLFEKDQNPGNIWQRRRFYLNCTIPSREVLFQDFLKTRKWQKFKNDYIQSNLTNMIPSDTKTDDIPIICRIVETTDD